ncbi:streptomycin resistance protein, partial [Agrobacterium sp. S2]|nr:streptomycin resistance protein [Agrobacterium sp. S2]
MTMTTPSFPASWNIEAVKQIADTPAGVVYELVRDDGSLAVAKVLKKKVLTDSLRGADFIEWRAGIGCVELLDRSDDILLMEHAGTETLRDVLFRDGDDDATTEIAAEVLLRYHQPSEQPPPSSLLTLPLYFESLFRKAEQDRSDGIDSAYIEAAALAKELIGQQRDIKPLHGDLHHENIM